jgi:cell division protein FtsQ
MPKSKSTAGKRWIAGSMSQDRFARRILGRAAGVSFLALAIMYGLVVGEHLEQPGSPLARLPGKVAGHFGYAADEIRITGLNWQSPEAVLAAIGVKHGGPLVGFEAARARRLLENLDWVKSAHVQRLFPNLLEIRIVERQPFAIWQREGRFYVIDETGAALTSVRPRSVAHLPVVTGDGAQATARELVNHLEAHPELMSKVKAAARVGDRRWNLYFAGPVKVLMPEAGMGRALERLSALDRKHKLLDKNVSVIDLRLQDSVLVSPPPTPPEPDRVLVVGHR